MNSTDSIGIDRSGMGRGLVLLGVAVLIGFLVLSKGLDGSVATATDAAESEPVADSELSADSGTPVTDPATGLVVDPTIPDAADPGIDPSTPDPLDPSAASPADTSAGVGTPHSPGEVTVMVLNASDTAGVAGAGTESVAGAGYIVTEPMNANYKGASQVLYTEGYEADALAVAAVFSAVEAAPLLGVHDLAATPAEDASDPNVGLAQVIVVIGNDGLLTP